MANRTKEQDRLYWAKNRERLMENRRLAYARKTPAQRRAVRSPNNPEYKHQWYLEHKEQQMTNNYLDIVCDGSGKERYYEYDSKLWLLCETRTVHKHCPTCGLAIRLNYSSCDHCVADRQRGACMHEDA